MEIPLIIKNRHSIRRFTPENVPYEKIRILIESARLAPSACNLQLTEFIALDDKDILEYLVKEVSDKFKWAPNFIVAIYDTRFTKHRGAGLQSCAMAIQNILLTAPSLGIGTCPMAGFEKDEEIKKKLNIPKNYEIALIIAVGNLKDDSTRKHERIDVQKILHHNKYQDKQNQLKSQISIKKWSAYDIINYRQRIAPVYLYKNHFHLSSFNASITDRAVKEFKKIFDGDKIILDIFSYDCNFIRNLINGYKIGSEKIIASDYLPYILGVIKKEEEGIKTVQINQNSKMDLENSCVDVVSCVNKLNFMVDLEKTFLEAHRVLKPKGKFFVVNFKYSAIGSILRNRGANVYENNPFYKIGPYFVYSKRDIIKLAKKIGFKVAYLGNNLFKNDKKNSKRYNFYTIVFEKV